MKCAGAHTPPTLNSEPVTSFLHGHAVELDPKVTFEIAANIDLDSHDLTIIV
jgi:hypothetical protein